MWVRLGDNASSQWCNAPSGTGGLSGPEGWDFKSAEKEFTEFNSLWFEFVADILGFNAFVDVKPLVKPMRQTHGQTHGSNHGPNPWVDPQVEPMGRTHG